MQGLQTITGQAMAKSLTATIWRGALENQLGEISINLASADRISEALALQVFGAGTGRAEGLAKVAVAAGGQATFLIKTVDTGGFTYTQGIPNTFFSLIRLTTELLGLCQRLQSLLHLHNAVEILNQKR